MRNDHDHVTTTPEAAGRYEAIHGDDYDPMRPSAADVEDLHVTMHRQYKAEAERRARGEYVPSQWSRSTASRIDERLRRHGVHGVVTIRRDGIFCISHGDGAAIAKALDGFDGEVLVSESVVWVRSEDSRWDQPPF